MCHSHTPTRIERTNFLFFPLYVYFKARGADHSSCFQRNGKDLMQRRNMSRALSMARLDPLKLSGLRRPLQPSPHRKRRMIQTARMSTLRRRRSSRGKGHHLPRCATCFNIATFLTFKSFCFGTSFSSVAHAESPFPVSLMHPPMFAEAPVLEKHLARLPRLEDLLLGRHPPPQVLVSSERRASLSLLSPNAGNLAMTHLWRI